IRDFHVTGVQTCALPICFFEVGTRSALQVEKVVHAARALTYAPFRFPRARPGRAPAAAMFSATAARISAFSPSASITSPSRRSKIGRAACREVMETQVLA